MSIFQRLVHVTLLSVLTTLWLPGAAEAAESTGNPGYVSDLVLNSSSSEHFGEYQGSVFLQEGDVANALKREYRWGGTVCGNYLPGAEQIRFLFEVMRAGHSLQVVPSYKAGVAGARCLVGVKIRLRPAPA